MRVIVPFDPKQPKTRLRGLFTDTERHSIARKMLRDVLSRIEATGAEPTVLATDSIELERPVIVDERSLSTAVNAIIDDSVPVAVVMADLGIVTVAALERLFTSSGDVVIAPGTGGGTNALVVRHPDFRVDYHGASYLDHRKIAGRIGASVHRIDSFRLATDIDEPTDLVELFVHGTGHTREWLDESDLILTETERGVTVERAESTARNTITNVF
jgi:2-phospho-L-lactate guanylyltransferase